MSSKRFEDTEDALKELINRIEAKIQRDLFSLTGEQRRISIKDAQSDIDEAYALINTLDDERLVAPGAYRGKLSKRITSYQETVDRFQTLLSRGQHSGNREQLLGYGAGVSATAPATWNNVEEDVQKRNALLGLEVLTSANSAVNRSLQISTETERVGANIMSDLDVQRLALQRTRDRLDDTNTNLSKSRWLLTTIKSRVVTSKIFLGLVVLLLFFILGTVVYVRFIKK